MSRIRPTLEKSSRRRVVSSEKKIKAQTELLTVTYFHAPVAATAVRPKAHNSRASQKCSDFNLLALACNGHYIRLLQKLTCEVLYSLPASN